MKSRLPTILALFAPALAAQDLARNPEFGAYWFRGEAEISRFALEESRYGETRKGDAVLVFVTEDFLRGKQVKHESGSGEDAVKVLKLNSVRKFTTGVYDYSMMSSVFSPLDLGAFPRSLKLTASVQEWCGHVWQQMNLRDGSYRVVEHSYFQAEGDAELTLPAALLEDEVWTRIRLAPKTLPVGPCEVIPGAFHLRLRHEKPAVRKAVGALEETAQGMRYTLTYADGGRRLQIDFGKAFPHRIEAFEESFTRGGKTMATRGTRTHTKLLDYWNKNGNDDLPLRDELGLPR